MDIQVDKFLALTAMLAGFEPVYTHAIGGDEGVTGDRSGDAAERDAARASPAPAV